MGFSERRIEAGSRGIRKIAGIAAACVALWAGPAGAQGLACDADHEAVLIYNPAMKAMQFCDGERWHVITGSGNSQAIAISLGFADVTGAALSAVIVSNSVIVSGLGGPVSVSVSGDGNPEIRIDGGAWAASGTIADGQTLEVRLTAANASATVLTAVIDIGGSTGEWRVKTAGSAGLYCWGSDSYGQLGNGAGSSSDAPVQIDAREEWERVSTGNFYSCGIKGGELFCWGRDDTGQQGNGSGSTADIISPEKVGADGGWSAISAGFEHVCGIKYGALYCWGSDGSGQIGNGASSGNVEAPEQIGTETTWSHIAAGGMATLGAHSCGISGGKLYCWGSDSAGQIGNGAGTGNVLAPEQIGMDATWQDVAVGGRHSCGVNAGKLFCWGDDSMGQIGDGSPATARNAPVQIGTDTTWSRVSLGQYISCGINAGTLFCWGDDRYGQVGNGSGSSANVYAPEQIGTDTSWSDVDTSDDYFHTCGVSGGKLHCWGYDNYWQLGNGPGSATVHEPGQIGALENWQSVGAGTSHSCGVVAP